MSVHLPNALRSIRNRRNNGAIHELLELLNASQLKTSARLPINQFKPESLDAQKVFHIDDIQKLCSRYRLRFLALEKYKSDLPTEAADAILETEQLHQTQLQDFKLLAPAKFFRLKSADDPMLFAPMGGGYYYLLHAWGKDMSLWRRCMVWPLQNAGNAVFSLFAISFVLSLLLAVLFPGKVDFWTKTWVLFLFNFKAIIGIALFLGIAKGKNFSEVVWDSPYTNA